MKSIKELEAEIGKTEANINNCDVAECSHKGWDALLDKQEAQIQTLKDVLKSINVKILARKMILKRRYNQGSKIKDLKRNAGHEAVIKALEELKSKIQGK